MNAELEKMDYKNIFHYFDEISSIPRGSGDNQRISDYLVEFAKKHGFEYIQDEYLNVIIKREASEGYENCPPVIIQGHMDMVCEKTQESTHDFTKDGLTLIVEDDYVHADGTTLGGDDGVAVAYALALLSDEELKSPKIEVLITTDEETGMYGAKGLDTSVLDGKYMINVDSEDESAVLISCAGGLTGTTTLPITRNEVSGVKVNIQLQGLKGGHSGAEIGNNRSSATKLLARLLFDLRNTVEFELLHMEAGNKDNVIPKDAVAQLVISKDAVKDVQKEIERITKVYQHELRSSEPELAVITTVGEEGQYFVLNPISFEKMLFLLIHSPYGVQAMSADIEGLVESSLNLGIFRVEETKVTYCFSVRSSVSSAKHFISDRLEYLSNFLGADYIMRGEYPAWEYCKDSKLRDLYCEVYKKVSGKDVKVEAIHAGLECGLIYEKMKDIDIISIGPDMSGIHTVQEKLSVPSSVRLYKVIEKVLEEMKNL